MGALSVTWNAKYQKPFQPLIPGVSVGRLNDSSSLELVSEDTCAVIVEPIQVRTKVPVLTGTRIRKQLTKNANRVKVGYTLQTKCSYEISGSDATLWGRFSSTTKFR
jgi:hypothetical protein